MSQEKPRKEDQEPIKYGDLFVVEGELANKTVAPVDAAMMKAAENAILGGVQKDGAAEAMHSAAEKNQAAGHVSHKDVTGAIEDNGISITQTEFSGRRVVSQLIGGQVVEQFSEKNPSTESLSPSSLGQSDDKENDPNLTTHPAGVAASVAAAARLNQTNN